MCSGVLVGVGEDVGGVEGVGVIVGVCGVAVGVEVGFAIHPAPPGFKSESFLA